APHRRARGGMHQIVRAGAQQLPIHGHTDAVGEGVHRAVEGLEVGVLHRFEADGAELGRDPFCGKRITVLHIAAPVHVRGGKHLQDAASLVPHIRSSLGPTGQRKQHRTCGTGPSPHANRRSNNSVKAARASASGSLSRRAMTSSRSMSSAEALSGTALSRAMACSYAWRSPLNSSAVNQNLWLSEMALARSFTGGVAVADCSCSVAAMASINEVCPGSPVGRVSSRMGSCEAAGAARPGVRCSRTLWRTTTKRS